MKREKFTVFSTGSKLTIQDLKQNPSLVSRVISDHLFRLSFEELERLFNIRLLDEEPENSEQQQTTIAITIIGKKSRNPKQGDGKIYVTSLNFL